VALRPGLTLKARLFLICIQYFCALYKLPSLVDSIWPSSRSIRLKTSIRLLWLANLHSSSSLQEGQEGFALGDVAGDVGDASAWNVLLVVHALQRLGGLVLRGQQEVVLGRPAVVVGGVPDKRRGQRLNNPCTSGRVPLIIFKPVASSITEIRA